MIAFVRGVTFALDVRRVEVERHRVDVGEDRRGSDPRDRLGRREEGEGGADHLVAAPDPERVQDDHERVRSVRDADRLRDVEVLSRLPLERGDVRPEHELPVLEDLRERLLQLRDSGAYCALTSMSGMSTGRV